MVTIDSSAGLPRRSLLSYRTLVWNLADRDLRSQYKSTFLGWAWALLVPLAQLLVYTLVFSVFLRAVPPNMANGREGIYGLWLFCAIVPWHLFASAVTRASTSVTGSRALFQKIYIPSYIPVVGNVTAIVVQTALEAAVLLLILLAFGNISAAWLLVVPITALFIVFVTATAYVIGVSNVYFRDVGQILPVVVQLLFFMSAILYPIDQIPEDFNGIPLQRLVEFNPVLQFTNTFRDVLHGHVAPSGFAWAVMLGSTAIAVAAAVIAFRRWGRDIGEVA